MRWKWAAVLLSCACACNLPSFPGVDQGLPPIRDAVDSIQASDTDIVGSDSSQPYDPGHQTFPDGFDAFVGYDAGCEPNCWTRVCGPDNCGGTCGQCPDGTVCSSDGGMCISTFIQAPMGGACGQSGKCKPYIESSLYTYPNPAWPGCLNDQCLEGPCLSWVCSRKCTMVKDTITNGALEMNPDGIEDADSPATDCGGGSTELFSGGFACVDTAPEWEDDPGGLCYPKSSFMKCAASDECPVGEACGFLLVRGFYETRCLAVPKGAGGLTESCGYDQITGKTETCESWACGDHGCTEHCELDGQCLTKGAQCDSSAGVCEGSGLQCADDSDCSAWVCLDDAVLEDPKGQFAACGPRQCERDTDCRDGAFYCRHEKGAVNDAGAVAKGVCAVRQEGGVVTGGYCDQTQDDGLPDIVCGNDAYCFDHHCGAMCTTDADCAGDGSMGCGLVEFEGGPDPFDMQPVPFTIPLCQWIGEPGTDCHVQSDCVEGVCTPWVPVDDEAAPLIEARCMEPPMGSMSIGQRCGSAAWDQECDTRHCLLEDASRNVAGYCSKICRTRADCPGETAVGPDIVKWLCESLPFTHLGSTLLADDLYASWCLPVPAASSLKSCGETMACEDPDEVCHASVRAPGLGGETGVKYLCVRPDGGKQAGEACDPSHGGKECRSGVCATTTLPGMGFCTRVCSSDGQCHDLGGGSAICMDRVVLPSAPPIQPLTVKECRVIAQCVQCMDDRDCGPGLRCVDLSPVPYQKDLRCVNSCETDEDCFALGGGLLCTDLPSPFETAPDGTARACAPMVCPG
ncbi:MAG: hypothetical protein GXP54_10550 [Deltaproteobacteria bacterium]|nr:hypothetical protein [Deltaproteobacteria bacterium]